MSYLPAQDVVERALAASTADGQITLVVESSEANLRWAANSLTTNGAMRSRQVVVISFVDGGAGMAAGTVTRTGTPDRPRTPCRWSPTSRWGAATGT
ncbi:MAG TPA: TldD/PmbA family protein, partial [Kribbella sp.]